MSWSKMVSSSSSIWRLWLEVWTRRGLEGVAEWVADEFWWPYVGEPSAAVLNRAVATQQ